MPKINTVYILIIFSAIFGSAASVLAWRYDLPSQVHTPLTKQKTESQKAIEAPLQSQITFFAVGDISLSRGIAYSIDKNKDPLFPWRMISETLTTSDFNFGNLETPFSSSDAYTAKSTLVFNAPKKNIEGLLANNFAVVSTANNHAYDQGMDGITQTRKWLLANNILPAGTGGNLDEAWQPATITKNNITVGFIATSYSSLNDGGKTINNFVARIENLEKLELATRNAKPATDFLVVSMHAGTEYTRPPNQDQVNFAHAALENGADIVIGHHPHWVQDKEVYCPATKTSRNIAHDKPLTITDAEKNMGCKPIYYSLGNFMFDQSWSRETTEGLMLKISVKKSGPKTSLNYIEEIPIKIENNCCPVVVK